MQKINRLKVLDFVKKNGPVARPEIAKFTGLSPSSITNIVGHLIEKNLLMETGTVDSKEVGRKATLIKFNPSVLHVICVNIEMQKVSVALTDLAGTILKVKELILERIVKDFEILDLIKSEVNVLINEDKEQFNKDIFQKNIIAGVGIAVSGLVLNNEQLVISSSLRWRGLSLKEYFENYFHLPVFVQNSSRTKALWKLSKDVLEEEMNIIFLDLAMGVGIINFYDHKINEAVIGELGHTTVKKDGPLCFCGNKGCLELMCSVDAVINQCNDLLLQNHCNILQELMKKKGSSLEYQTILEAFQKGDTDVEAVLKECGEYLGIGLANIINIFNPQRIIINGDVLLTSDFIYHTAIKESNKRINEQLANNIKYERVNIDFEEAIKGVALHVADRIFEINSKQNMIF